MGAVMLLVAALAAQEGELELAPECAEQGPSLPSLIAPGAGLAAAAFLVVGVAPLTGAASAAAVFFSLVNSDTGGAESARFALLFGVVGALLASVTAVILVGGGALGTVSVVWLLKRLLRPPGCDTD